MIFADFFPLCNGKTFARDLLRLFLICQFRLCSNSAAVCYNYFAAWMFKQLSCTWIKDIGEFLKKIFLKECVIDTDDIYCCWYWWLVRRWYQQVFQRLLQLQDKRFTYSYIGNGYKYNSSICSFQNWIINPRINQHSDTKAYVSFT